MSHALPANSSHNPRHARLRDRALMLQNIRSFFAQRQVVEVDCPLLSPTACIDAHIDLIPATFDKSQRCYLHSSPEYGMKRVLCEGIGDCYQLGHVFRDGEAGHNHSPEFTLLEWYRLGWSLSKMIAETLEICSLFLGQCAQESLTYRDALITFASVDPATATDAELKACLGSQHISVAASDRDDVLNLILALFVEPQLGQNKFTVLTYYPASQAALAQTIKHQGWHVAERFEVYYKGKELANGYHELADPIEQRRRLVATNAKRSALGKGILPMDELFLEALSLKPGLPDCCGVAVGFDRLMMLRHAVNDIADILPQSFFRR